MASKDPLIRHAISPPAFDPRNAIHRERLVDAIHGNMPRKLIAIAAPAGYGKTTLLADFAAHTDLTACWFRFGEADWDVMRVAQILAASLQSRFRRLKGQPDLDVLATASPEALAVAFTSVIEEQIAETFVLAFDDVHLVNRSEPVLQFLDRLLEDLPEQATVIAAGREVLEVSLARLMAERDLAGFGPHDLALSRQELVELTELQQGEPLPEPELDHVLEESRGWVTGIVMSGRVSDVGAGSLIGGGRTMVYEYLASVVLNRQPDDLRRFALEASVLPIMAAASCDSVLDRTDSQRYLRKLERRGLFVTASASTPKTYEFHPLFREFLMQSLEGADPRRLATLRRRAAEYLLANESPDLAIDLLIEAGSIARAAKLAESNSKSLVASGRVQTVERWAEQLRETGATIPVILLHLATTAHYRGNLAEAQALIGRATSMIDRRSTKEVQAKLEIAKGFHALQLGDHQRAKQTASRVAKIYTRRKDRKSYGIATRITALAVANGENDYERAERLASEAAEQLAAADDSYNLWATLTDLANFQYYQGKTPQANQTRARVLELARSIGAPQMLSVALNNSALGAHVGGDYERALRLSKDGLKNARLAASPLREGINLIRQADVFNDLGLSFQAAELYGDALSIFMSLDVVYWIRYSCVQTSALHRRNGGSRQASEWIKRALELDEGKAVPAIVRLEMAALEAVAAPKQAIQGVNGVLRRGTKKLDSEELTLARYLKARALLTLGEERAAMKEFAEAMTLAGTFGTEQIVAAELRFDDDAWSFVQAQLGPDPTLSVVGNRIETMNALSRRYQDEDEAEAAEGLKIEIKALGDSSVFANGVEASGLKPSAREVLFYIVEHKRVSRDQLVEAFWPGQAQGRQTSNLHTAVYSIRHELGKAVLLFDGSVYSLNPEMPIEYDVARFEQAANIAEGLPPGDPRLMFALTEAMNSYGGEFLLEIDSEWVDEKRRSLQLRFLDILASRSEEALMRDRAAEAIASLREALKIDPLRDDTNRFYLEALGRLGRRSEIVGHYQQYVRLLSEELGLDPPDEVRDLYDRLIS